MKLNWQLQEDFWLSAINHDAKYYINACCGKHINPWIDCVYANEKKILLKKCIVSTPPPLPFIFIIFWVPPPVGMLFHFLIVSAWFRVSRSFEISYSGLLFNLMMKSDPSNNAQKHTWIHPYYSISTFTCLYK